MTSLNLRGWGAGMMVGTIGVRFNNFAMRNFLIGRNGDLIPQVMVSL